ncbi:MAG: glutaconyl-CoA/methylmalonyl-CoA decarboxylase subunit delta [Verrucomicrobiota bacterium]|nr:glutaconyl-CoA/methylmalonyl-CoA decarboxylase subunit delta [Verrucomicrobiota bacterium]
MNAFAMPLLPLAAALPEHPALGESIIYQLNGLVVVFTALCLIWGLLEVMALWFKRQAPATVRGPKSVAAAMPPPVANPGEDLEPTVVAAMAAAVHATLGGGMRITSIVRVDAPDHGWGLEGRRQIHSARKVR